MYMHSRRESEGLKVKKLLFWGSFLLRLRSELV